MVSKTKVKNYKKTTPKKSTPKKAATKKATSKRVTINNDRFSYSSSPSLGDPNNALMNLMNDDLRNPTEIAFLTYLRGKTFIGQGMYQLLERLLNISIGQGGRDDLKLRALRLLGLLTHTVDDKHDAVQNIHVHANFCSPDALKLAMIKYLGPTIKIDIGELDFFFSPGSWANARWSADLLKALCELARVGILAPNAKFFLPYFEPIKAFLETYEIRELANKYFRLELSIPGTNGISLYSPLYYAACLCEKELKELKPSLYNANQEKYFINSKFGWYILTNKWIISADESKFERDLIVRRLNGYGPNGMQTRKGSGSIHFLDLNPLNNN